MSNEAHSRETCPTVRWGESAAEIPSVNVVEPSGGKKDTGWVPGVDRPNAGWWNWLHWADGVFHRYVERVWDLLWPLDQLMTGNSAATAVVTAGTGLSVDITSAVMWIDGAMYTFVAANDLALGAAHATLNRYDLIVARISGGVPTWTAIQGTASGSPVVPSAAAGDVAVAYVSVPATATVPGTITDVRIRGNLELDRMVARTSFAAQDIGGGDSILSTSGSGSGAAVQLGNGLVVVTQTAVAVEPEQVSFLTAITRRLMLGADRWIVSSATPTYGLHAWSGSAGDGVVCGFTVPHGVTIKAIRVRGNKTTTAGNLVLRFRSYEADTLTLDDSEGPIDNDGDPIGDFTLEFTGLSIVAASNRWYYIDVDFDAGAGTTKLYGAEVEYEEEVPFNGV